MTAPYTDAELAAILARAEAATAGPWSGKAMGGVSMVTAAVAPPSNRSLGVAFDGERNGYSIALPFFVERTTDAPGYYRSDLVEMSHADAAFIAAARVDVPRLVAELSRAREVLTNVSRWIAIMGPGFCPADLKSRSAQPWRSRPMSDEAVDISSEACALVCMIVSNPEGSMRREGDGWQKRVNDLIRALRDALAERTRELDEAQRWIDKFDCCMCGSRMSAHDIGSGHSPVSMYDYHMSQTQERAEAAERECAALRDALLRTKEQLGEAIHVAFRKASSHEQADKIWHAIRALPNYEWDNVIDFIIDGLGINTALAPRPPVKEE
jgi:hypothetical protein